MGEIPMGVWVAVPVLVFGVVHLRAVRRTLADAERSQEFEKFAKNHEVRPPDEDVEGMIQGLQLIADYQQERVHIGRQLVAGQPALRSLWIDDRRVAVWVER